MATIFKRGSAALLFALLALLPILFLSSQIASANNSRLFAVMDYNGNFVRGSNVVSITQSHYPLKWFAVSEWLPSFFPFVIHWYDILIRVA